MSVANSSTNLARSIVSAQANIVNSTTNNIMIAPQSTVNLPILQQTLLQPPNQRYNYNYFYGKRPNSFEAPNKSVRFGRVPKREKAKILAAMQKVNANSQEKALCVELEDENRLLATIIRAHEETCDYTREKVAPLVERARTHPVYAHCPPQMACPLNPMPQHVMENGGASRILEDFSERFSPAIRGVVEFAKRIPGFGMLQQDDQVTLLKAGVFEVLLVRLACMFDSHTNSMICLNGLVLRREALHSASNARFLLDSMFDFAERLNSLRLTDSEIGLFCAVVVIAADRPGLRNVDLVQKIYRKLDDVLQKAITANHPENPGLFAELKKKIPDLKTLNTLHSEKLLAYKMEPRKGQNGQPLNGEGAANVCSYASLFPEQWSQFAMMTGHGNRLDDDNRSTCSPGQGSHHGGSDWSGSSDSKDGNDGPFGSPRSVSSSGVSTDDSAKSPLRTSTASSAKSNGFLNGASDLSHHENGHGGYSPSQQMAAYSLSRRPRVVSATVTNSGDVHNQEANHNSGDESYYVGSPSKNCTSVGGNYAKIRRVDSPTDSGIESGKEHCNGSTPTTSVCSSPRSAMDDKVKDVSDSESSEKQESIDDMPMLKRALQAPPLINTNMLMDEAYRHHKKFRAAQRKEGEPPSPSTTTHSTNSPSGAGGESLASSHSTLLKTLEQPSRYMNEQQLKRTDLIHNIIMRSEAVSTSTTLTPSTPSTNWRSGRPVEAQQSPVTQNSNLMYHLQNVSHQNVNGPASHQLMSPHHNKGMDRVVNGCPPGGYYIPSSYPATCPYSGASVAQAQGGPRTGGKFVSSPSMTNVPRIVYSSAPGDAIHSQQQPLQTINQAHHRRSPCSPSTGSQAGLVNGSAPAGVMSSPHQLPHQLPRSCASSPITSNTAAIFLTQNEAVDSQPLNLSKKPTPPNSPPTDHSIKMET